MPKYLATQHYTSGLYPGGIVAGDVLDLEEGLAGSINRDAPGTLVPNPEGVKADDRQQKAAPQRRDRGTVEPITKAEHKAVKNP